MHVVRLRQGGDGVRAYLGMSAKVTKASPNILGVLGHIKHKPSNCGRIYCIGNHGINLRNYPNSHIKGCDNHITIIKRLSYLLSLLGRRCQQRKRFKHGLSLRSN